MSGPGRRKFEAAGILAQKDDLEWSRTAALAPLIQSHAESASCQIACAYAYRGETDPAFAWLDRAYRQRDAGLSWGKADLFLQPLHVDPRWAALMRQLGLTDEQLKP